MKDHKNFNFVEKRDTYLIIGTVKDFCIADFKIFDLVEKSIVGNIYRGRILNKIKGLNAYFVDIGLEKNGFYQVESEEHKEHSEGEEIILEVISNETADKGPKLRRKYELKSENFILTPFEKNIKISKKISDNNFLNFIEKDIKPELPKEVGIVVRTSAYKTDFLILKKEVRELISKFEMLKREENFSPTPKLLIESDHIAENMKFTNNEGSIFTNDKEIYSKLIKDLNNKTKVIYDKNFRIKNIPKAFSQIQDMFKRKLTLDNGIELVFDKTEALNVIDVNSKGFLHKKSKYTLEDVNKKSLLNIIKQIVFRNICGIILIDFISFKDDAYQNKLLSQFHNISKSFNNPPIIVGFTKLGILELTRNRKTTNIELEKITTDIF